MRALVVGWFSYPDSDFTAGDLLARDLVCEWLAEAGIPCDVALTPPLRGGVDINVVDPAAYSHAVFVCGPFMQNALEAQFLRRFAHCFVVGVNLTLPVGLGVWNPFDYLIERDSTEDANPDITFLSRRPRVPVVGLCLVEPYDMAMVAEANAAIAQLLAAREAAVVRIDTRLDINTSGLRTCEEIESLLARMDVVVTTRLHGAVLALKNGVPALAVDPEAGGGKIVRQAETIGWPVVFAADALEGPALQRAFDYCLSAEGRAKAVECRDRALSRLEGMPSRFTAAVRDFSLPGPKASSRREFAKAREDGRAPGATPPPGAVSAADAATPGGPGSEGSPPAPGPTERTRVRPVTSSQRPSPADDGIPGGLQSRTGVSVVVTCHDLGAYLDEAVESVFAQTFADVEVIVVDDGSTDPSTRSKLDEYERRRDIRVLRSENRGLPAARNLGIATTRADLVCMLDADDRLEPTWLEKAVALLAREPDVAFVSHWLRAFGDEEWEWRPERCDFPALLDSNTVNGAAVVRRSALLAVGGFDETMRDGCEDWDLWIRMIEAGYRGAIIPEFLFQYRRRANSMSRRMEGALHLDLYRQLVTKNPDSYRRHLESLLLRREGDIGRVTGDLLDIELEHDTWLWPRVQRLRQEADHLRRRVAAAERGARGEPAALEAARRRVTELEQRLEAADTDREALRRELDSVRREADVLLASKSWRITAPLRAVYIWMHSLRRGA